MLHRLNSAATLIQRTPTEAPRLHMYYIGLDVHKKTISYCVKDVSGRIQQEGKVGSSRRELDGWMKTLPQPWSVGMEATIFSGWIYDHLLPHAAQIKVAHPLMLRAIAAAKKKNDQIDASKIADCLRCDFLPESHMMPQEIRDRRRTLRYRHLLVRQMVQMKNRVSGTADGNRRGATTSNGCTRSGYFRELLSTNTEVSSERIRPLLKLSRETIERCQKTEYALVSSLQRDPVVGRQDQTTQNSSWSGSDHSTHMGSGNPRRCLTLPHNQERDQLLPGLCGDERSSADKVMRMPLSKQRNKHIQRALK